MFQLCHTPLSLCWSRALVLEFLGLAKGEGDFPPSGPLWLSVCHLWVQWFWITGLTLRKAVQQERSAIGLKKRKETGFLVWMG